MRSFSYEKRSKHIIERHVEANIHSEGHTLGKTYFNISPAYETKQKRFTDKNTVNTYKTVIKVIIWTNTNTIELFRHNICHNTRALSPICNNESLCFSKVVSDHHLVNFDFAIHRQSLLSFYFFITTQVIYRRTCNFEIYSY